MAETARLISLLQTSSQRPYPEQPAGFSDFPTFSSCPAVKPPSKTQDTVETKREPIPSSFVEALQHLANGHPLPTPPSHSLSADFKVGLTAVLSKLNEILPLGATSATYVKQPTDDFANDLAVANCKRVFAAATEKANLEALITKLKIPIPSPSNPKFDTMAGRLPVLSTSNLPAATAQEASATASPARGSAMLNSIFKSVRVPEFRFKWQFWAEKGQQTTPGSKSDAAAGAEEYASRPKPLGEQIVSVKEFYQHFNNIPVDSLKLRDSIHLFHVGVKPLWEDPRNARGGAFYFRIGKELAPQFWHEICLLAVGDVLQGAVETKRECKPAPYSRLADFSSRSSQC